MSKQESFDAGPLLLLKIPQEILDQISENVVFEGTFIEDLLITLENRKYQRFAVDWRIEESKDGPAKLIVWQDPTASSKDSLDRIEMIRQIYRRVVVAKEDMTGVVHEETEKNAKKCLTGKQLEKFEACRFKGGGSYEFIPAQSVILLREHDDHLPFCNRSTRQYTFQEILKNARMALFYSLGNNKTDTHYDQKSNRFYNKAFTRACHIERGAHKLIVRIIINAINHIIASYQKKPLYKYLTNLHIRLTDEGCKKDEDEWEKNIRYNKEKFSEHLCETIYIAAGYNDGCIPGRFWPELNDSDIVGKSIDVALDKDIKLPLDQVPPSLKEYGFSTTALMFAAKKTHDPCKFYLVTTLVENGADPALEDSEGHNAVWYAENSGNTKIAEYLKAVLALRKALSERDIKKIESCFPQVHAGSPIKGYLRPIDLALPTGCCQSIVLILRQSVCFTDGKSRSLLSAFRENPSFHNTVSLLLNLIFLNPIFIDSFNREFKCFIKILASKRNFSIEEHKLIKIGQYLDSEKFPDDYFQIPEIIEKIAKGSRVEFSKFLEKIENSEINFLKNILNFFIQSGAISSTDAQSTKEFLYFVNLVTKTNDPIKLLLIRDCGNEIKSLKAIFKENTSLDMFKNFISNYGYSYEEFMKEDKHCLQNLSNLLDHRSKLFCEVAWYEKHFDNSYIRFITSQAHKKVNTYKARIDNIDYILQNTINHLFMYSFFDKDKTLQQEFHEAWKITDKSLRDLNSGALLVSSRDKPGILG